MWIGEDEIHKSVIETFCADGRGQVIYDICRDFIPDEETDAEMVLEEDVLEGKITSLSFSRAGEKN